MGGNCFFTANVVVTLTLKTLRHPRFCVSVHVGCSFGGACEVEIQCEMWGLGVGFQLR